MHDKRDALAGLGDTETLVLVGDHDLLTPADHSEEIHRALPHAEFALVRDAGHLVMLEHPEIVTPHLVALLHRARRRIDGSEAPEITVRPACPSSSVRRSPPCRGHAPGRRDQRSS